MADLWSDAAVLERSMGPASEVPNTSRKASERTASPQRCCGVPSQLPSALLVIAGARQGGQQDPPTLPS